MGIFEMIYFENTLMKSSHLLYVIVLGVLTGLSACDEVFNVDMVGDGNRVRQSRTNLSGFESLYLDSDFEVNISSGDVYSVEVEADSNLLSYIETEVVDGELNISVSSNFNIQPRHPVRVYLEVPDRFSGIEVIDGGQVKADSLYVDELNVTLYGVSLLTGKQINCPVNILAEGSTTTRLRGTFESLKLRQRGSGNMIVAGQCEGADVILEGSGKIDAKELDVTNGDLRLYGSGLILCHVSGYLKAKVDGSGRIYYYGDPGSLEKELDGDGMIVPGDN